MNKGKLTREDESREQFYLYLSEGKRSPEFDKIFELMMKDPDFLEQDGGALYSLKDMKAQSNKDIIDEKVAYHFKKTRKIGLESMGYPNYLKRSTVIETFEKLVDHQPLNTHDKAELVKIHHYNQYIAEFASGKLDPKKMVNELHNFIQEKKIKKFVFDIDARYEIYEKIVLATLDRYKDMESLLKSAELDRYMIDLDSAKVVNTELNKDLVSKPLADAVLSSLEVSGLNSAHIGNYALKTLNKMLNIEANFEECKVISSCKSIFLWSFSKEAKKIRSWFYSSEAYMNTKGRRARRNFEKFKKGKIAHAWADHDTRDKVSTLIWPGLYMVAWSGTLYVMTNGQMTLLNDSIKKLRNMVEYCLVAYTNMDGETADSLHTKKFLFIALRSIVEGKEFLQKVNAPIGHLPRIFHDLYDLVIADYANEENDPLNKTKRIVQGMKDKGIYCEKLISKIKTATHNFSFPLKMDLHRFYKCLSTPDYPEDIVLNKVKDLFSKENAFSTDPRDRRDLDISMKRLLGRKVLKCRGIFPFTDESMKLVVLERPKAKEADQDEHDLFNVEYTLYDHFKKNPRTKDVPLMPDDAWDKLEYKQFLEFTQAYKLWELGVQDKRLVNEDAEFFKNLDNLLNESPEMKSEITSFILGHNNPDLEKIIKLVEDGANIPVIPVCMAMKDELHKYDTRMFYMAPSWLRYLLRYVEQSLDSLLEILPGDCMVCTSQNIMDKIRKVASCTLPEATGKEMNKIFLDSLILSFDNEKFSSRFPRDMFEWFCERLSVWMGQPFIKNLRKLFDQVELLYVARGHYFSMKSLNGFFEGFFNKLWSVYHICVMEHAVHKIRVAGLLTENEIARLAVFSDDGALGLLFNLKKPIELKVKIYEMIKSIYSKHGLKVSDEKTWASSKLATFLNKVYYEGVELISPMKAYIKITDTPLTSLYTFHEKASAIYSTTQGSIVSGLSTIHGYMKYFKEMYILATKMENMYTEKNELLKCIQIITPQRMGGYGMTSVQGLASTAVHDQESVGHLMLLAFHHISSNPMSTSIISNMIEDTYQAKETIDRELANIPGDVTGERFISITSGTKVKSSFYRDLDGIPLRNLLIIFEMLKKEELLGKSMLEILEMRNLRQFIEFQKYLLTADALPLPLAKKLMDAHPCTVAMTIFKKFLSSRAVQKIFFGPKYGRYGQRVNVKIFYTTGRLFSNFESNALKTRGRKGPLALLSTTSSGTFLEQLYAKATSYPNVTHKFEVPIGVCSKIDSEVFEDVFGNTEKRAMLWTKIQGYACGYGAIMLRRESIVNNSHHPNLRTGRLYKPLMQKTVNTKMLDIYNIKERVPLDNIISEMVVLGEYAKVYDPTLIHPVNLILSSWGLKNTIDLGYEKGQRTTSRSFAARWFIKKQSHMLHSNKPLIDEVIANMFGITRPMNNRYMIFDPMQIVMSEKVKMIALLECANDSILAYLQQNYLIPITLMPSAFYNHKEASIIFNLKTPPEFIMKYKVSFLEKRYKSIYEHMLSIDKYTKEQQKRIRAYFDAVTVDNDAKLELSKEVGIMEQTTEAFHADDMETKQGFSLAFKIELFLKKYSELSFKEKILQAVTTESLVDQDRKITLNTEALLDMEDNREEESTINMLKKLNIEANNRAPLKSFKKLMTEMQQNITERDSVESIKKIGADYRLGNPYDFLVDLADYVLLSLLVGLQINFNKNPGQEHLYPEFLISTLKAKNVVDKYREKFTHIKIQSTFLKESVNIKEEETNHLLMVKSRNTALPPQFRDVDINEEENDLYEEEYESGGWVNAESTVGEAEDQDDDFDEGENLFFTYDFKTEEVKRSTILSDMNDYTAKDDEQKRPFIIESLTANLIKEDWITMLSQNYKLKAVNLGIDVEDFDMEIEILGHLYGKWRHITPEILTKLVQRILAIKKEDERRENASECSDSEEEEEKINNKSEGKKDKESELFEITTEKTTTKLPMRSFRRAEPDMTNAIDMEPEDNENVIAINDRFLNQLERSVSRMAAGNNKLKEKLEKLVTPVVIPQLYAVINYITKSYEEDISADVYSIFKSSLIQAKAHDLVNYFFLLIMRMQATENHVGALHQSLITLFGQLEQNTDHMLYKAAISIKKWMINKSTLRKYDLGQLFMTSDGFLKILIYRLKEYWSSRDPNLPAALRTAKDITITYDGRGSDLIQKASFYRKAMETLYNIHYDCKCQYILIGYTEAYRLEKKEAINFMLDRYYYLRAKQKLMRSIIFVIDRPNKYRKGLHVSLNRKLIALHMKTIVAEVFLNMRYDTQKLTLKSYPFLVDKNHPDSKIKIAYEGEGGEYDGFYERIIAMYEKAARSLLREFEDDVKFINGHRKIQTREKMDVNKIYDSKVKEELATKKREIKSYLVNIYKAHTKADIKNIPYVLNPTPLDSNKKIAFSASAKDVMDSFIEQKSDLVDKVVSRANMNFETESMINKVSTQLTNTLKASEIAIIEKDTINLKDKTNSIFIPFKNIEISKTMVTISKTILHKAADILAQISVYKLPKNITMHSESLNITWDIGNKGENHHIIELYQFPLLCTESKDIFSLVMNYCMYHFLKYMSKKGIELDMLDLNERCNIPQFSNVIPHNEEIAFILFLLNENYPDENQIPIDFLEKHKLTGLISEDIKNVYRNQFSEDKQCVKPTTGDDSLTILSKKALEMSTGALNKNTAQIVYKIRDVVSDVSREIIAITAPEISSKLTDVSIFDVSSTDIEVSLKRDIIQNSIKAITKGIKERYNIGFSKVLTQGVKLLHALDDQGDGFGDYWLEWDVKYSNALIQEKCTQVIIICGKQYVYKYIPSHNAQKPLILKEKSLKLKDRLKLSEVDDNDCAITYKNMAIIMPINADEEERATEEIERDFLEKAIKLYHLLEELYTSGRKLLIASNDKKIKIYTKEIADARKTKNFAFDYKSKTMQTAIDEMEISQPIEYIKIRQSISDSLYFKGITDNLINGCTPPLRECAIMPNLKLKKTTKVSDPSFKQKLISMTHAISEYQRLYWMQLLDLPRPELVNNYITFIESYDAGSFGKLKEIPYILNMPISAIGDIVQPSADVRQYLEEKQKGLLMEYKVGELEEDNMLYEQENINENQ